MKIYKSVRLIFCNEMFWIYAWLKCCQAVLVIKKERGINLGNFLVGVLFDFQMTDSLLRSPLK